MDQSNERIKVCHLTSAHTNKDTRIFYKQARSLAKKYDVSLIAYGESFEDEVNIVGLGKKQKGRVKRILLSAREVFKQALTIDADIYHLHDPELLPYAIKLKKKRKIVIFDSHEDYPLTILDKKYIPKFLRKFISNLYTCYENKVIKKIDGAIACYHWTYDRYKKVNNNIELIFNFPIYEENIIIPNNRLEKTLCYAGGISNQWNHHNLIKSLPINGDVTYNLCGKVSAKYFNQLQQLDGWNQVNYMGVLPYDMVQTEVYSKYSIGVALLGYISQCKGTTGNLSNTKLFEYMHNGLPVICTDFELWKEIIDKYKCGLYVNPYDITQINKAINYLFSNPAEVLEMGKNGRKAVRDEFNWKNEEKKLFSLYEVLINRHKNY